MSPPTPTTHVRIDRRRLEQSIQELSRIGATAYGGLTRVALTDADRGARDRMVSWMREAGLQVSVDRMGNIFGQRAGRTDLPAVVIGSHVDSVPTGAATTGSSVCCVASRSSGRSTTMPCAPCAR